MSEKLKYFLLVGFITSTNKIYHDLQQDVPSSRTQYVGTIQFMSGLLNLFPYDIAEKILYKYFFGIDKEKDDHEKAKGELLLRANHRLYKNIQDCYNFTGKPQTAVSDAQFYEKNRSFLKHIIPELVAVMHDCNCCIDTKSQTRIHQDS